ncbi:MAG: type VI secretion system baseplate subunit TssG [Halochromatium sp.]|nr:type VI secretion system baseplate subunit TssG [Halochromatium sp.]
MANPSGRSDTTLGPEGSNDEIGSVALLGRLLKNPRAFSFAQAVRLLRQAYGPPGKQGEGVFLREQLRVRPELSLGFPPTDMTAIREITKQELGDEEVPRRFEITATFLGLYGPSSPLPTFYTEELLDEQREDQTVSRDFLDVLNHRFFVFYFLADLHYKLVRRVCTEQDTEVLTRLYALAGLGHPEMLSGPLRDPGSLLRAIGLLTQFPRSAAGLQHLLMDRLGVPVEVVQCAPRKADIPLDQRAALGAQASTLGANSHIGTEADAASSKIQLRIGAMDAETFRRYQFGTPDYAELVRLICYFCTQPLEFDLQFLLAPDEAQPASLGSSEWSSLGCNAWMAPVQGQGVEAQYLDCRRIEMNSELQGISL